MREIIDAFGFGNTIFMTWVKEGNCDLTYVRFPDFEFKLDFTVGLVT